MNYFAHGRAFTQNPYFMAGTAVPDWLSVIDRQVRVRLAAARSLVTEGDLRIATVAQGVLQHLTDDAWFHQTPAFYELNITFTRAIRTLLSGDDGYRPAFLGHILIEILLDAELIAQEPCQLDSYYQALGDVDPQIIEAAVNRMAARSTDRLAPLVPRFISERFLYDYADDTSLLRRLNQVMRRVNLPLLPHTFLEFLPQARTAVAARASDLLTPKFDLPAD